MLRLKIFIFLISFNVLTQEFNTQNISHEYLVKSHDSLLAKALKNKLLVKDSMRSTTEGYSYYRYRITDSFLNKLKKNYSTLVCNNSSSYYDLFHDSIDSHILKKGFNFFEKDKSPFLLANIVGPITKKSLITSQKDTSLKRLFDRELNATFQFPGIYFKSEGRKIFSTKKREKIFKDEISKKLLIEYVRAIHILTVFNDEISSQDNNISCGISGNIESNKSNLENMNLQQPKNLKTSEK